MSSTIPNPLDIYGPTPGIKPINVFAGLETKFQTLPNPFLKRYQPVNFLTLFKGAFAF